MSVAEDALVVFARTPRPGQVKTRLTPPFTADEACEIHAALVGDMIERAAGAAPAGAAISIAWSDAPGPSASLIGALPPGVTSEIQQGGDLGERMALTIQSKLRAGHRRVVILGSDAPTLPGDHVAAAFEALRNAEVVIGPTADGGYYLIGMSRLHLEIFLKVNWGTAGVLRVTRRRLKDSGAAFVEIGPWYDVDTPEDVARLWKDLLHMKDRRAGDLPRRTWYVLARLAPGRISI